MSSVKVNVNCGQHGLGTFSGEFTALSFVKKGSKGWFVTIPGREINSAGQTARLYVGSPEDVTTVDGSDLRSHFIKEPEVLIASPEKDDDPQETDEQAMARMRVMFQIMEELVEDAAEGRIFGLVLFGPPGVGKSYNVFKTVERYTLAETLTGEPKLYTTYKGYMTPPHLYKALYDAREQGQIAIFDDCDRVLLDPESLNMLKAALDTTNKRTIHYASESSFIKSNDLPTTFDFKGTVIFITNMDFDNSTSKIAEHQKAIISRCHYVDLTINSQRDKLLWIREVTLNQEMYKSKRVKYEQAEEILDWIESNVDSLRDLSLRTFSKVADLYRSPGEFDWRLKAEVSCLKKQCQRRKF